MADDPEEKYLKEHNAEELKQGAMRYHMMFMGASMASGVNPQRADKDATAAMDLLKARFT